MNELLYYNCEDEEGYKRLPLIQASEGIHPYMKSWWPAGHINGYRNFVMSFMSFRKHIESSYRNLIFMMA